MIQLQWTTKGILASATEIVDGKGNIVGTMNRRNSFKHRTTARYDDIALEFDYDGSFRDSVNLFDAGGNKIGHYHADLWGEAGVFHDVADGEDYHFERYGKFYEYKFKLQLGDRDLVLYEITSQKIKQSAGTIHVMKDSLSPRLILIGLFLAAYN